MITGSFVCICWGGAIGRRNGFKSRTSAGSTPVPSTSRGGGIGIHDGLKYRSSVGSTPVLGTTCPWSFRTVHESSAFAEV